MIILNTRLCRIMLDGGKYRVLLLAHEDGSVIEHEPFDNNQQGLVAALLLAADVNAGKFFLRRVSEPGKSTKTLALPISTK